MQGDALDHDWLSQAEFANAVAYGQITPGPGHAHDRAHRLGRRRACRRAARVGDRLRALVRVRDARRRPLRGDRASGPARARSSTAPARPRSARSSARRCCSPARSRTAWQWAVLAAAAAALALGRSPLLVLLGRRGRRSGHHYDHLMADALQEETADVLAKLIQFNTVNPPGDERACQEWLRDYLTDAGLECELDGRRARAPEPRRHARRRGAGAGARLPLARRHGARRRREDWTHDPWSGEIHDGFLWGRGAIDMKSQTAAEAVAAARAGARGLAARQGRAEGLQRRRRGDRRRSRAPSGCARTGPDLARADFLLNEGAGTVMPVRRPPAVRRLLRREGHVPLRRPRPRPRRARLRAGDRRQRAAQARARARAARLAQAALRRHRRAARVPARDRRRPGRPGGRRGPRSARSSRGWPRCSSRRSASPSPRRSSPPARRST